MNLSPPLMSFNQAPLRNLPRLTDDMRNLVEVESRMRSRDISCIVGIDIGERRCRWTKSSAAMNHILDELDCERLVST
jgi:hypothetical protein